MHEDIIEKIEIPENVEVSIDNGISIKGPKGELKREFPVDIRKEGNNIIIEAKNATKNKKKIIKTARAHIKNMIKGVMEGYEYLLQICSVHFPITVTADKEKVNIKNFLGETTPRKAKIVSGVQVKIEGDIIKISSPNIESAGQTAANIETATKIKNRDRTRFQDGIWIINKAGEEI
jgi:large subunit ribosomal protein L6